MSLISRALLKWYDANARELPWRVGPAARRNGERPDPYRVWLSEIMLQQTTVASVRPRFNEFLARWPTIEAMAASPVEDILSEWAGLGYYARARNLHKCAVAVAALGRFPETENKLRALPGIGPYTAAAIAAIAFDAPSIVVDGNVERVAARLFAIETPLPRAKPELKEAIGAHWPKKRSGDFAQGLMDLGALVCTPRNPKCLLCPLSDDCEARAKGIAESLPRKVKKSIKPMRRGIAYALFNADGEMLFERRPDRGLLGGMLGLPGTQWLAAQQANPPLPVGEGLGVRGPISPFTDKLTGGTLSPGPSPTRGGEKCGRQSLPNRLNAQIIWRHAGTVAHAFTHFHLELDVMVAFLPKSGLGGDESNWLWLTPDKARLPTVMKKAVERALAEAAHSDESWDNGKHPDGDEVKSLSPAPTTVHRSRAGR